MKNKTPLYEFEFEDYLIKFTYFYDPGVHTYSNGDPGYPPDEDYELIELWQDNKLIQENKIESDEYDRICKALDKHIERDSDYLRHGDNDDYDEYKNFDK